MFVAFVIRFRSTPLDFLRFSAKSFQEVKFKRDHERNLVGV